MFVIASRFLSLDILLRTYLRSKKVGFLWREVWGNFSRKMGNCQGLSAVICNKKPL